MSFPKSAFLVSITVFFILSVSIYSFAQELKRDISTSSQEILTLKECIQETLSKNPRFGSALHDVEEQEQTLESSKKDLYPSLSFQYIFDKQLDNSISFGGNSLNLDNYYSYAFSVEQPVYRGKSLVTAVEIGELNLMKSESNLTKTRNDIIFAVHEAYFNILKARKFEDEAKQAVLRLESHKKDAKAFYDAGLIPKNDYLVSEVELAQGLQDLLRAKNSAALATTTLSILMKRPAAEYLFLEDITHYEPYYVDWDKEVQKALSNRPEIVEGDIAVQQATKDVVMTKAEYLPSVSVSATYKKQGDNFWADTYPIGSSEVRSAQAFLNWRFWAWGQKRNKTVAAERRIKKAEKSVTQVKDNIIFEIREAHLNLLQAEQNISVTQTAVEQAEENYRLNEARYQAQLATSTEVLDAQTLLTRANVNYYNALYDHKIAIASLNWATGTIGQQTEIQ